MFRTLALLFWIGVSLAISACAHRAVSTQNADTRPIETVLMKYIDGTSQGKPELLQEAFYKSLNLYSRNADGSLKVWDGQDYISRFEPGKPNNRVGRIISIDQEDDIAVAKVEIEIPGSRIFTDYFLLVKYEGEWKIIHKSYTSRAVESF